MAQLSGRISFRDIVENTFAQRHRLYHLGSVKLSRSNLSRINEAETSAAAVEPADENDTQERQLVTSYHRATGGRRRLPMDLPVPEHWRMWQLPSTLMACRCSGSRRSLRVLALRCRVPHWPVEW